MPYLVGGDSHPVETSYTPFRSVFSRMKKLRLWIMSVQEINVSIVLIQNYCSKQFNCPNACFHVIATGAWG